MMYVEKAPLVSVLMPAFNSSVNIGVAIQSVLNSTLHDFELIITDDNSTDSTFQIASEFAHKDQRIKLFKNDINYGDYGNRNKAASYATGKYLKYVDHDDFIYPNGLETIVSKMEEYPMASVGFFSLPQNKNKPYPILLEPEELYKYNFFGPGLFYKAPLSSIILRSSFEDIGGFKNERYIGDFELWHRMAQKFNVLLIQDHIVWYREHNSQESGKMKLVDYLKYDRIELNYILDKNSPITDFERDLIIVKRLRYFYRQFFIALLKLNSKQAILYFNKVLIFKGWKK